MKYCKKCGKELMDEAVICVGCGCIVGDATAKKRKSKSKLKFYDNYDLFLNMFFSILSFALLFIDYFYACDGIGAFVNMFYHMYDADIYEFALMVSIVVYSVFLIGNVTASLFEFFKKKNYGIIKIICSFSMLAFVINNVILLLTLENASLLFWFYVETIILISNVFISILNSFGIYILKKRKE